MRRIILLSFFFLFAFTAIAHREISYFLIRTVAQLHSGCTLSYQTMSFKEGRVHLSGVVASKPDLYVVKAEQLSIGYDFPNSFQLRLEAPHITLSPQLLKIPEATGKSILSVAVEVVDGLLDWTESALASSSMNLSRSKTKTDCHLRFEQGFLSFRDGIMEWDALPIEWGAFLAKLNESTFPFEDPKGTWSGKYDGKSLHAEIAHFVLEEKDCIYNGTCSLDWQKPNPFAMVPEYFRLSLHSGQFITPHSSITNIELLATYQAGKWGMCECQALFGALPFSFSGKGFFANLADGWMDGTVHLGSAVARLFWEAGSGNVQYEGISPKEITCLQKLCQVFEPKIAEFDFVAGSLKGNLTVKDTVQMESLEAKSVHVKHSAIDLGCKKLTLSKGDWSAEEAFANGFRGEGSWSEAKQELLIQGLFEQIPVALNWTIDGITEGHFGDLRFLGNLQLQDRSLFASLSHLEGVLPDLPQIQGRIVSGSADLQISYADGIQIDQWQASGKMVEGAIPGWNISGGEVNLLADHSIIHLNGKALFTCPNGLIVYLNAPKIRIADDHTQFDLRIEDDHCYLMRAVGSKQGSKIELDNEKSHLFGSPIGTERLFWGSETLENGHFESRLDWPVVSHYLEKIGLAPPFELPLENLHVAADFNDIQGLKLAVAGGGWQAKAIYREKAWNVTAAGEQMQASCELLPAAEALLQVKNGKYYHPFLTLGFEGKLLEDFSADLILSDILGNLSLLKIDGLQGPVQGRGCLSLSADGIESDLDIQATSINWKGMQLESANPIHLYCSSKNGVLMKGLDVRATKGMQEAQGKIGLLEFNKKRGRVAIQKAAFHVATDLLIELYPQFAEGIDAGSELDLAGTFDFSTDFSELNCTVERASLPIAGQMRQFKDLQLVSNPRLIQGITSIAQRDKWADISLDIQRDGSHLKGLLHLEEKEQARSIKPLSIAWTANTADSLGIAIHSIEGNFAGLEASFKEAEIQKASKLVGTVGIDFNQLRYWIDPEVDLGLQELGVGQGYELKGALSINRNDLTDISFQGILGGKQFQLFDFQFRTLMSNIEFSPGKLLINSISIGDSAVTARIDEVLIQSKNGAPWTILMPLLTLEDFRPSLLRKMGDKEPTLSPLIIREFTLRNFSGLLDDGKTYRAKGELSFVNTFKREETFFDLPSNFFGRIIGLDLDLLVPVIGDLTFDLKNGYFQLKELRNTYSEGQRSEFFLVDADAVQRVDLRGNLEILVKMRQFVLFALTEGFMISIDGNLSDPKVSLQKRLKFE